MGREQTVPKYQRPRNKRRRPDVLALPSFLSLYPISLDTLERTCPKQTFFPPCRDLCRPIVGRESGKGADKERRERQRRKHVEKRRDMYITTS